MIRIITQVESASVELEIDGDVPHDEKMEIIERVLSGEDKSQLTISGSEIDLPTPFDDLLNFETEEVPGVGSPSLRCGCTWEIFTKPPLGVKPYKLWVAQRIADLEEAIEKREDTPHEIPEKWRNEREFLIELHKQCGQMGGTFKIPTGPTKEHVENFCKNIREIFHKRTTEFENLEGKNVTFKLEDHPSEAYKFEGEVIKQDGGVIQVGNVCVHISKITHIEGREV